MSHCASELALELHLHNPARSRVAQHLTACPGCRERLAQMEAEGEHFRRFIFPRTVDRIVAAWEGHRSRWRTWMAALLPAGAVAAAAALMLVAPVPPDDYVGAKGTPFSVQAWRATAEGARPVADGDRVPASSVLRFKVALGTPCHLWMVSVDGRGEVSRLYPAEGKEPAPLAGGANPLPGGVALDGVAGPERLYAVCSPEPLALSAVEGAARAAAGEPGALQAGGPLRGLPAGTIQATLLVEKVP